ARSAGVVQQLLSIEFPLRNVLQTHDEELQCAALVYGKQFSERLHGTSASAAGCGVASSTAGCTLPLQGSYQRIGCIARDLYPCTLPHGIDRTPKCRRSRRNSDLCIGVGEQCAEFSEDHGGRTPDAGAVHFEVRDV